MKTEYNAIFDKLTPQKSDDELLRAVIAQKENTMNGKTKKRSKKTIMISALIAAALAVTTVGVSAANGWNLTGAMSDVMRNIFGKKNELQPVGDTFKQLGFENLKGKELWRDLPFQNYYISLKGVAADKYTAFLIYDIEFDNDFDCELKPGEEWNALWTQTNLYEWDSEAKGDKPLSWGHYQNGFLGMDEATEETGAIAHCYTEIVTGHPLQGKTMKLSFDGLSRIKADGTEEQTTTENCEYSVTFDFDTEANSKTLTPNKKFSSEELGGGKITSITASSFGLAFDALWDDRVKTSEYIGSFNESADNGGDERWEEALGFKVLFKDGTEKGLEALEGGRVGSFVLDDLDDGKMKTSMFPHWKYPVNVDDIVSVTLCGETFKFSDAVVTPAPKTFKDFDFQNLEGKELNDVFGCDGYKIAFKGVTADRYTAYVMYDVILDEGFKLPECDGVCEFIRPSHRTKWDTEKDGEHRVYSGYTMNSCLSMEDNIAHCFAELSPGVPLQGRTINFETEGLRIIKNNIQEQIVESSCEFSITFDFDTLVNSKTLEPDAKITTEEYGSGKVKYISSSPFGIMMTFVWDDGKKVDKYFEQHLDWESRLNFKITFKDGTERDLSAFDQKRYITEYYGFDPGMDFGDDYDLEKQSASALSLHWTYPVNTDDIESVTICGQPFTFD